MKALIFSSQQFLYLSKPPPWKPKYPIQTLSHSFSIRTNQSQANAKGFGEAPSTIKEPDRGKNSTTQKDNNDDEEIPEVVFKRILVRILAFVGFPLALGLAFLKMFEIIKEQKLLDVPLWVPYLTTFLTFGTSAMGVAYGTLSASMDPEKEGSVLGLHEAQMNWVEMWKEEDENNR